MVSMRFSGHKVLGAALALLLAAPVEATPLVAREAESSVDTAQARQYTAPELSRLERGLPVHWPHLLTPGKTRVLGTVSSLLVKAPPEQVIATLFDARTLKRALPSTQRVVLLEARPAYRRFELVQGNGWVHATFTVHMQRTSANCARFWLDRSRPHDVVDVRGWFCARAFQRNHTLMTVAVAADLGSGPIRWLFGGTVQKLILSTPESIRRELDRAEPRRIVAEPTTHGNSLQSG